MAPTTAPLRTDSPPLITNVVRGGGALIDRIANEWRALCEAEPLDVPFYRPEWIAAYVRAFAPDSQLVLITARCEGRLVAVLPLIKEMSTVGGMPARKLRSAGNAHTCKFELVHESALGSDVISAVWKALLEEPGWDVIELEKVPTDGALARLAQAARQHGHPVHVAPLPPSPFLTLDGGEDAFERLMARLDAKFRSNLRRRMRKLEAHGSVALFTTRLVDPRLARFYDLERAGWKGAQQTAIASDAPTKAFYDELAREAARFGYFALYSLDSGSRTAAMFYGLAYRGRYSLLKMAYDEALHECSPGQLLTHEVLRALADNGDREFDFLGELMDWKLDWAPSSRHLTDVHVFRGPTGRALHALRYRLRPAAVRLMRRVRSAV